MPRNQRERWCFGSRCRACSSIVTACGSKRCRGRPLWPALRLRRARPDRPGASRARERLARFHRLALVGERAAEQAPAIGLRRVALQFDCSRAIASSTVRGASRNAGSSAPACRAARTGRWRRRRRTPRCASARPRCPRHSGASTQARVAATSAAARARKAGITTPAIGRRKRRANAGARCRRPARHRPAAPAPAQNHSSQVRPFDPRLVQHEFAVARPGTARSARRFAVAHQLQDFARRSPAIFALESASDWFWHITQRSSRRARGSAVSSAASRNCRRWRRCGRLREGRCREKRRKNAAAAPSFPRKGIVFFAKSKDWRFPLRGNAAGRYEIGVIANPPRAAAPAAVRRR